MGTWHARTFSRVAAGRRYVLECLQQQWDEAWLQAAKQALSRQTPDKAHVRISRSLACQIIMRDIDLVNYATY